MPRRGVGASDKVGRVDTFPTRLYPREAAVDVAIVVGRAYARLGSADSVEATRRQLR